MATVKKVDLEVLFSALADRTRLRLLNLMNGGEVCVCFFVEILQTNQPKISRHLAYLRRAGIVAARREGKWMHYRIVEPSDAAATAILREVLRSMAQDQEMQRDRERLRSVCCSPNLPVQLEGAPSPISIQQRSVTLPS
ncbi:MAG: metalloregulator ArsR/SmtB family transcription factor [Bacteroidota bacterium]